jgi:hypothetical protein
MRGIWRAGQHFDCWYRNETMGVRALFTAVLFTVVWFAIALVQNPFPHDRWFQTFTGLRLTALIALGIAPIGYASATASLWTSDSHANSASHSEPKSLRQ